jgi:1,4-dihydroxy-2-naphthoate octaprenyltransferase
LLPVLAGSFLGSLKNNYFLFTPMFCALMSALLIQVSTNYFNDAIDHKKGADTSARLGPKRMSASGEITPKKLFIWAFVSLLLAILFSVPLILNYGLPILLIGLCSLYFAYGYTGGPYPLAYNGLGEVFVFIFFGLVAVCGSYFLQTKVFFSNSSIVLGIQMGALSTILISINNFRDHAEDSRSNKHTLAVLWGVNGIRCLLLILFTLPYLMMFHWIKYYSWKSGLVFLVLPLSIFILKKLLTEMPSVRFNRYLALASLQYLLFTLLLILGIQ